MEACPGRNMWLLVVCDFLCFCLKKQTVFCVSHPLRTTQRGVPDNLGHCELLYVVEQTACTTDCARAHGVAR